ncbi:hypothetical protein E6H36_12550 [Candidatus Bathyarchaeota archaeon]|nr:MAG: hypothetical protein E6H36_12550 [Candidatus Bathyarchaeota archaeon]
MSKTIQIFTVVTIIGLMMFGFFSGVPGLSIPRAAAASGTAFDNVVTILMENHGLTDIVPSATYMTSLANTNGLATHYVGVIHPSEGNYVAMISGDTYGFTGDCGYCPGRTSAPNIVDRLESAGLTWQAFAESASGSGTCSFHPPRGGDHYAFITFTDIQTNSARCANMLNTSESNDNEFIAALNTATPANYIWLTPTDSNNMHDNSVSSGDAYLSTLVPRILSSTTFTTKRAALFIVFDEGNDNCSFGDCVYASWIGPSHLPARFHYQPASQSPLIPSSTSQSPSHQQHWAEPHHTASPGTLVMAQPVPAYSSPTYTPQLKPSQ